MHEPFGCADGEKRGASSSEHCSPADTFWLRKSKKGGNAPEKGSTETDHDAAEGREVQEETKSNKPYHIFLLFNNFTAT